MRILVTQITRMGDMLQTSPLFPILKRKYPDCHITALVRPIGKAIAERIPQIDEIMVYEEDDLFRDLVSGDSDRLLRAYGRARDVAEALAAGRFDRSYNCSHSTTSALLLKLARFPEMVGTDYSDDWRFVIRGPWISYFFTSIMSREYNALNLCDVTQRFELPHGERCGLVMAINEDDRAAARSLLESEGISAGTPLICLQLGASDDNKRWSIGFFASLAQRMADAFGARIALVGVESEKKYGAAFEEVAPGLAVHLFGKTSIGVLAAVLESARLLVTNDTGTMHIAAAVNCPIALISVGYVQFRETGPYAAGCYAIEKRRHDVKHTAWTAAASDESLHPLPDQVFRVVEHMLGADPAATPSWPDGPEWEHTYIYRSDFAADSCLEWYPVIRRAPSDPDLLRLAYRAMWLELLDPEQEYGPDGFTALLRCFDFSAFTLQSWAVEMKQVFSTLADMAQTGIVESEHLIASLQRPRGLNDAKAIVTSLMQLDERMRVYSEVNRATRPLVVIARFGRDSLEGADPSQLAKDTLLIYHDLRVRCLHMAEGVLRLALAMEEPA